MIRHIVFFTARDAADLPEIETGLNLLSGIPHARHFEVRPNLRADRLSNADVDFVVYAEFDSEADLAAYKAHPLYQASIDRVKPLRDTRIAADIAAS
ncbi:stress responsive alpha/beta barrel protein [Roseovarius halotolerans]|uniref:Stress responsive A/B Barrel Domain protein n=1 Tax=Roseovarius halotolerans TaxID=505353 RepID=A0A1X6ZFF6_9RHOB|nr:Dabb family protein [Roseovarius halotolerans]RKT30824.1 stress responsive alpha/beta barrel protein [Roseovarius halotolerans]SLN49905.1 Stress responsive A/B Barrel Domain protein [Roseovarius halotolerans]